MERVCPQDVSPFAQSRRAALGPTPGDYPNSLLEDGSTMKKSRIIVSSLAAVSLLGVSACVTDPNTGERHVSRTAIGGVGGAALGYLLGGLIGGKTARIVG